MAKIILITISLLSLLVGSLQLSPTGRKVTLISSDGEAFEVDEAVAAASQWIKHTIDGDGRLVGVPLPRVTGEILAKVIEYSERHTQLRKTITDNTTHLTGEIRRWDESFASVVDNCTMFRLAQAASYLGTEGLSNLAHHTVMIRAFDSMELRLSRKGKTCWSVYGCIPSGGWLVVPSRPEPAEGGGCQD